MKNLKFFDVLVVYFQGNANSASEKSPNLKKPFSTLLNRGKYNEMYGYFLENFQKNKLSVGLSTSADIIGPGKCKSFWTYNEGTWNKFDEPCFSKNIFDKFSPENKKQYKKKELLFSYKDIKPFNKEGLIFFGNKFETYKKLKNYAIPTVEINRHGNILESIERLDRIVENHNACQDFTDQYILKNRNGAGGDRIFKISDNYCSKIKIILEKEKNIYFILQPFVKFDKGYEFQGKLQPTDIRLIYMDGKIVQSYLRIAKPGDFRCNQHQGGKLEYVSPDSINSKVIDISQKIVDFVDIKNCLYALDFIVSNDGNPYFLEGNIGPGLTWDEDSLVDEKNAKQLMKIIINEFKRRIVENNISKN